MHGHQRFVPEMYWQAPYENAFYPTIAYPVVPFVVDWYNEWPKVRTILLAITLLLSGMAIIGLDIANLAIENTKLNETSRIGLGTDKVGAGIWSGSTVLLAAIFMLVIVCVRNKQIAATFALISTILAVLFMIVLIGLIGNTMQTYRYVTTDRTDLDKLQEKLLIVILALAGFIVVLCMIYFILYIRVFFALSTRVKEKYQY